MWRTLAEKNIDMPNRPFEERSKFGIPLSIAALRKHDVQFPNGVKLLSPQ
jgi:hypothetical protein